MIAQVILAFLVLPWKCYWWRRRESNPRPKILPSRIYMLSPGLLVFAPRAPPEPGSLVAILLNLVRQRTGTIVKPALRVGAPIQPCGRRLGERQSRVLSCYCVVIIVGDYKVFPSVLRADRSSACNGELIYSRRIRFAPFIRIWDRLNGVAAHGALQFSVTLLFFQGGPFIVLPFSPGKTQFDLGLPVFYKVDL